MDDVGQEERTLGEVMPPVRAPGGQEQSMVRTKDFCLQYHVSAPVLYP